MKSSLSVTWSGKSGNPYTFSVHPLKESQPNKGGIYIFCKGVLKGDGINLLLTPLYIGRATSFEERMYDHHKMGCAIKNGANYICLMEVPTQQGRESIEKDLLTAIPTTCNEKLNPVTPK